MLGGPSVPQAAISALGAGACGRGPWFAIARPRSRSTASVNHGGFETADQEFIGHIRKDNAPESRNATHTESKVGHGTLKLFISSGISVATEGKYKGASRPSALGYPSKHTQIRTNSRKYNRRWHRSKWVKWAACVVCMWFLGQLRLL